MAGMPVRMGTATAKSTGTATGTGARTEAGLSRAASLTFGLRRRWTSRAATEETERSSTITLQINALQALCRQVFGFRLAMIALAAPGALLNAAPGLATRLVGASVVVTFMGSYVLFRDWERFGPLLLRHPTLLAADTLCTSLLLVSAGPDTTLAYVSVCTPLLAGIVYGYRGAAVFASAQSLILLLAYAIDGEAQAGSGLAEKLLLPGLCVITGALGSSLRNLMLRFGTATQALTTIQARLAVTEAVSAERARLAREMHDSVAKTLHGVALAAEGLAISAGAAGGGGLSGVDSSREGLAGVDPSAGVGSSGVDPSGVGLAGVDPSGVHSSRVVMSGVDPSSGVGASRVDRTGAGSPAMDSSPTESSRTESSGMDASRIRQQAELVARAARRAAAESRELLADLRRESDPDHATDIAPELAARTEAFTTRTGMRATYHATGETPLPAVPPAVARHLLTITEEALENAHRHAKATCVDVRAGVEADVLRLSVQDDGRGLPAGTTVEHLRRTGHFGLLGMTERAASIGARIHIGKGRQARGTEVRLELPLAALTTTRTTRTTRTTGATS